MPLSIGNLPAERVDPSIEAAIYGVVAEVVAAASAPVAVRIERKPKAVTLYVRAPSVPSELLVEFGDRIGAVDGTLTTEDDASGSDRAASGDPMRVVIAEDEALLREGLARLLSDPGSRSLAAVGRRTSC